MKLKKSYAIILSIILLFSNSNIVFAHPSSQEGILAKSYIYGGRYNGYFIGGDKVGWAIDEANHTNITEDGLILSYYFSEDDMNFSELSDIADDLMYYTREGVKKWNGIATINEVKYEKDKEYPGGVGVISTFSLQNSTIIAQFRPYSTDSSGHLKEWGIEMNLENQQSAIVMAHEIGHAIGLVDLFGSISSGKLMYAHPESGTATGPTAADVWGVKVITGQHTTHTWGYKYYNTNSTGNVHVKYCTDCNGLSLITEQCTYNSQNICHINPYDIAIALTNVICSLQCHLEGSIINDI